MAINPDTTKRVQGYIDNDCYKAFTEFCSDWECSQSKGLELLIKKALIEGNLSKTQSKSLVPKEIESIIEELQKRVSKLENAISTQTPPEKPPESLASDFSKLVTGDDKELTYQELATKEGLKRSTVKSWIDRGLPTKGDNAKYSKIYEVRDGKFYLK